MATFIKAGFWEQLCKPCTGYKGWLNLDELIKKLASTVVGPPGPQGVQGDQGIQGVEGPQGIQGETGAALTVLGSYPDLAAFLAGAGGDPGEPGTAWIIESDGSLYVWNTATNAWEDVGDLQGPQGIQGIQGPQGEQGVQGIQGIQGPAAPSTSLFAQTGNSTIITGITESTLINGGVGTLTVPANGFQVGDSYRAVFGGVMNAANNQTIRIRVKAGSVVLLDSGLQDLGSSVVDDVWSLNVDFTIRQIGGATVASIVSLGSFHYTKTNNASVQGFGFNVVNNTTFNTTITNVLDVTAQWGAANAANNIYSDIFILNKTY